MACANQHFVIPTKESKADLIERLKNMHIEKWRADIYSLSRLPHLLLRTQCTWRIWRLTWMQLFAIQADSVIVFFVIAQTTFQWKMHSEFRRIKNGWHSNRRCESPDHKAHLACRAQHVRKPKWATNEKKTQNESVNPLCVVISNEMASLPVSLLIDWWMPRFPITRSLFPLTLISGHLKSKSK